MDPAVDVERLAAFSDGSDEGVRAIVGVFLEGILETSAALREAVTRGDRHEIHRLAHRASGSCGAGGASRLAQLLESLDNIDEGGDAGESVAVMAAVERELERVAAFLQAHLTTLGDAR